jgi:hypothetical protein
MIKDAWIYLGRHQRHDVGPMGTRELGIDYPAPKIVTLVKHEALWKLQDVSLDNDAGVRTDGARLGEQSMNSVRTPGSR